MENLQRFFDAGLFGGCLENAERLLLELFIHFLKRDIWPQFIGEPKRGSAKIEQVAGDDQLKFFHFAPRDLFGHLRDEVPVGTRVEIAVTDHIRTPTAPRNYV